MLRKSIILLLILLVPGIAASQTAAGYVDGYYERGIQPWDSAAGTCIAREAGAIVSDGGALDPVKDVTIAGNAFVHAELERILRGFPIG